MPANKKYTLELSAGDLDYLVYLADRHDFADDFPQLAAVETELAADVRENLRLAMEPGGALHPPTQEMHAWKLRLEALLVDVQSTIEEFGRRFE